MKTNILIDTSVILDGLENITSLAKDSNVFVTDIVLREIDGNKGAEGAKGYNAREFFRQFNSNSFTTLQAIPFTDKGLKQGDTLTQGSINSGANIFTLTRKWYRSKDINDTKIIEIADDYDLKLCTLDQAQSARAKSIGVEAEVYKQDKQEAINIITLLLIMAILYIVGILLYLAVHALRIEETIIYVGISTIISVLGAIAIDKTNRFFKHSQKTHITRNGNSGYNDINPATGLPIIGGIVGGVDAAGNTYGSSGEMVSAFEIGI